nr:MAG TPA: hypothetical protein [Caudoviricetes sp.]
MPIMLRAKKKTHREQGSGAWISDTFHIVSI